MAKANSFKAEPWTALEKCSWSIFDDDFIQDKLTFKLTKKSATSTVSLKDSLSINKDGKVDKQSEQLKFWFPFQSRTFYGRIKNNDFKVHLDNGLYEHNGVKYNLYTSYQANKNFSSSSVKVGLEASQDRWSTNWRIALKPYQHQGITLYNKSSFSKDNWRFWFVNAFEPIHKIWVNSAFQIAHKCGNSQYFLRANTGKKYTSIKPINLISDMTMDYIYNYNANNKLGLELNANVLQRTVNTAVAWDHKCEKAGFKLRADVHRNVACLIKNNIQGYGSYNFGVNINDLGHANRFGYGLQIELNL